MSFKFRYRLSLLFVLAALVAGVSFWLRQAVVRDRNIRQLLAEEWFDGQIDHIDPPDATLLNTRILNFFTTDAKFRDGITHLVICLDNADTKTSWQKYHAADFGESLGSLCFVTTRPPAEDSATREPETIKLSQLDFWLRKFRKIESLAFGGVIIVNDVQEELVNTEISNDFQLEDCDIDTTTLKKLIGRSKNIDMTYNRIRGKLLDLSELNLPWKNQAMLMQTNTFTEDTP